MSISSIGPLLAGSGGNVSTILSQQKTADTSAVTSDLINSIDANHDKKWSEDEVSSYAKKYQELTGNTLDVSDIFKNYDVNGDKTLDTTEQASLLKSGDLGLDNLDSGYTASPASLEDTLMAQEPSMSGSLLMSSLTQESSSSLLSLMFNTDKSSSVGLLSGVFGKTSIASAAEAYWTSKNDKTAEAPKVDTKA